MTAVGPASYHPAISWHRALSLPDDVVLDAGVDADKGPWPAAPAGNGRGLVLIARGSQLRLLTRDCDLPILHLKKGDPVPQLSVNGNKIVDILWDRGWDDLSTLNGHLELGTSLYQRETPLPVEL